MNSKLLLFLIIGITSAENKTETVMPLLSYETTTVNSNYTTSAPILNQTESAYTKENNTAINENTVNNNKSKLNLGSKKSISKYRIRDPLLREEQSPNGFLSERPGLRNGGRRPDSGIDPRIAQILQSNPRLRALAEQNPEIAQEILRNPRLLRDPRIQSAIQSQLGPGGGGLLSLLPGLTGALNPFGIGTGGARRGLGGPFNGGGAERGGLFGAPRGANRGNRLRDNEENIGGGYYGNNRNYDNNKNNNDNSNQNNNNNNENNNENSEDDSGGEDQNNQDYDNSGQEGDDSQSENDQGGQEGQEGQEAQDPNQDPANDPDIQQLQNLGGGAGDNFPEGLFPPGLLSKEDLDEIRKQQEKQAKEQAEREKQQQQANNGDQGQDYDYGQDGDGGEGADGAEKGGEEDSNDDTSSEPEEEPVTEVPTTASPPVYRSKNSNQRYKPNQLGSVRQSSVHNPGVQYDEILDENTPTATPPSINSINQNVGKPKVHPIPVPDVRGHRYRPQPVQPYVNTPQPVSGVYQQPIVPQQPHYQQPVQYYPPYQPQYGTPQQYLPQQQYQPQYIPQQQYPQQPYPGQYIPQQPLYQQNFPPQPIYQTQPQPLQPYQHYNPQHNPNVRQQQGVTSDPNIKNHKLNSFPHDDAEDGTEGYDEHSATESPYLAQTLSTNGQSGHFQQQPRIFSPLLNQQSSDALNITLNSENKFNKNNNNNTNV